jgi:heptosyltransferase-2
MRVVVFCPNLIGDTVMATPALRALRRGFPGAHFAGVMKPPIAPTLAGGPWLDEVILTDPGSKDPSRRFLGVVQKLRAGRFDLAVLLPNSARSALMAMLGGIPRRAGYARGGRALMLTDKLAAPTSADGKFVPVPIVGYYLGLARILGCPEESPRLELYTTSEDERAADAAWERLGLAGKRVVCLNTGGAFGPAKNWPIEHFADLAAKLAGETGRSVLVVCGPAEKDNARAIVAATGRPDVVSLADETLSIGLSKASIKRAELLVTTDSGPRHFATAFGVPVVSLFGPTAIGWTRTYHPRAIHLQVPVPCGPCQKPTCAEGHHRCMRDLDPGSVFEACLRLLGQPRHRIDQADSAARGPLGVRPLPVIGDGPGAIG